MIQSVRSLDSGDSALTKIWCLGAVSQEQRGAEQSDRKRKCGMFKDKKRRIVLANCGEWRLNEGAGAGSARRNGRHTSHSKT